MMKARRFATRTLGCLTLGCLTLGLLILLEAPLNGQQTDFFENFDDGNFMDGMPVTWDTNPVGAFPGSYDAGSGDFNFFPLDDKDDGEIMVAWVPEVQLQAVGSVRMRGYSFVDETGFITSLGRVGVVLHLDPNTVSAYAAVVYQDGTLQLTRTDQGTINELATFDLPFGSNDTFYVQLDHDGVNVSTMAWLEGDPQPEVPQISMADSTYTSGAAGLAFAEDGLRDLGVFEIAQAANIPSLRTGDLNLDTLVDGNDIDAMYDNLFGDNLLFDLNEDGDIETTDLDILIRDILGTEFGDANLDGRVDDADHAIVDQNLFTPGSGWSRGDFNGDGLTDGQDFNIWNTNKGFGVAANAVPEPASGLVALLLLGAMGVWRPIRH